MSQTKVAIGMLDATGTASSSTFLRGDSTWNAPAGGGWAFVGETTASTSASIAFTNMTTGYDWKYVITNLISVTDGTLFGATVGVSGPSYRTSDYRGIVSGRHDGGSTDSGEFSSLILMDTDGHGSATNEQSHYDFTLFDPAASGTKTAFGGQVYGHSNSGDEIGNFFCGGTHNVAEAIVAIEFKFASGNISSGLFRQYKRPNA